MPYLIIIWYQTEYFVNFSLIYTHVIEMMLHGHCDRHYNNIAVGINRPCCPKTSAKEDKLNSIFRYRPHYAGPSSRRLPFANYNTGCDFGKQIKLGDTRCSLSDVHKRTICFWKQTWLQRHVCWKQSDYTIHDWPYMYAYMPVDVLVRSSNDHNSIQRSGTFVAYFFFGRYILSGSATMQ